MISTLTYGFSGGLQVFQDGVEALVTKGVKKISPFFIPYAITNMCASPESQNAWSQLSQLLRLELGVTTGMK